MKNRKLIAKSNLKKSLYLGGGMAAFTAAIGLAVSIPVYNKIQADLATSTSKLRDLSGMMSQLTNKLGIPEGASFQKELEGGYEVVYENGQTKIYKNNGEGKSLIINMNGDGTVGSAASMQGPAAQAMLGVIRNAQDTISQTGNAMDDIIGPFANQAEDESLQTEAAITGASVAELAQRNAMSAGEDEKAKAAAAARLAAIAARNKLDQATLDAAKDKARELKAAAEAAKKAADELAAAKKAGDAALLKAAEDAQANASVKVLQDFVNTLNWKKPPAPNTPDASDAPGFLSQPEIIALVDKVSGWAKVASLKKPEATDFDGNKKFLEDLAKFLQDKIDGAITNDQKNNLKVYYQTQKIAAAAAKLADIRREADEKAEEAKEAATAATTSHQMADAAAAGKVTPAIVKLAKSLPNAINALMSAKYGYLKNGVLQSPSKDVFDLLKTAMKSQGVSQTTFDTIIDKIVTPIHNDAKTYAKDANGKYTNTQIPATVSFTEAVNTFSLRETSVSRLLVLKATYVTKASPSAQEISHEKLYLAKQTTKSPLDFEGTGNVLQSISNLKPDGTKNTLYTAASYLVEAINREINPSITKDAVLALKNVVSKGVTEALKGIKHPEVFNELVTIAKSIDPINKPIQEKALVEILLSLAKKYLFEGKDIKINGQQIVDIVNGAMKYDGTKEPELTMKATNQSDLINYGPLLKSIIKKINDPAFLDYSAFANGAKPTLDFVNPDMVSIEEVKNMFDDKSLQSQIPYFKAIEGTTEGKSLIAANWNLVLKIMKSPKTIAEQAVKIIKDQDFSSVTSNMDYLQTLMEKLTDPANVPTPNVYAELARLTSTWGYKGKTTLSDEEKQFRNKIIEDEIKDSKTQEQLPSGDISFDAISKAFEILAANGYIKSDSNADDAKVKIFEAFMNKETDTKEFSLSIIASLDKYSAGHDELVNGGYINDVIERMLKDEDTAKTYTYAIKQLDLTETILKAAKTDPLADLSFAIPYKEFIFEDKDTTLDLIKSIHRIVNYINNLNDSATDEANIAEFKSNVIQHIFDKSTAADIDKIFNYIKYMIDQDNAGRKTGDKYSSAAAKDATLKQIKMYGDKFFKAPTPIGDALGDEAKASQLKFKSLVDNAGSDAAKARLKVLTKFPTITDAWQSGIVDATPVQDSAFSSQKEDQSIPTTIKSIGYDDKRGVFYMIGTLSGAASIKGHSAAEQKADKTRHKVTNGIIEYDANKGKTLYLFEAKLTGTGDSLKLEYHRITDLDFAIESDYNKGRPQDTGDNSWNVKQPMSDVSVSTYDPLTHSFVAYGAGQSYAHGHSKIWYDNGWHHEYVVWKNGKFLTAAEGASQPKAVPGSLGTTGKDFGGYQIGDNYTIGMSTIIDGKVYGSDGGRGIWYEINPGKSTNALQFTKVPGSSAGTGSGFYTQAKAGEAAKWTKFPKIGMIASVTTIVDESSGATYNKKWAVFVDTKTNKLMRVDIVHHTMEEFTFKETDKDGKLIPSSQLFANNSAITTTETGSIYVSAGKDVGHQQVYRIFLSNGEWQMEKVGNEITGLSNYITSLYHYTNSAGDSYIIAISLDGVKVIKDIFAA